MRKMFCIVVAAQAALAAGCAGSPPSGPTSSTQGTTTVRSGEVAQVLPSAAAGGAPRVLLRYDDGGSAMLDTAAAKDLHAGDRVRVTTRRNAVSVERLGP